MKLGARPSPTKSMETREGRLATWARPCDEKLKDLRVLRGWLAPNSTDPNQQVRTEENRIDGSRISVVLLDPTQRLTQDDGDRRRPVPLDQWYFEVLSFPRLQEGRLHLSLPKGLFHNIQDAWGLHPRTLEVFLSNNGILSPFISSSGERTSILFKVPNSRSTGFDCVSVTCHQARRTTYVLYHHLEDEASIFETLLATPECCLDPHFFIAAVYRSHHQHVETHRNTIDDAVRNIERQTGFGNPGRLTGRRPSLERYPTVTNSTTVLQQLSYCQSDLAIIASVARGCLSCGEWLLHSIDETESSTTTSPPKLRAVRKLVRQDVQYSWRRTETLLFQVQAVKDRAQSQTNFVSP